MMQELPELPYPRDALEPWLSRETLDYHYGKHHAGYVRRLNELIEGTEQANLTLEELVRISATASGAAAALFNNAAQAWNHAFYWQCLSPRSTFPSGYLAERLHAQFGSIDAFQRSFSQMALENFGSGWTWLVGGAGAALEIINTANAGTPLTAGKTPLLTCDVWEHAYYIDYRNARFDYLQGFWKVVNWDFVAAGLGRVYQPQDAA